MALNYDDGTNTPDGWFCSGIADYTTWNSLAAESVNGRLLEPTGPFVAAVPFRDGILAWKDNAMYRGDYVGSPVVWQWTRVASDIGCCGKNMACVVNDIVYFADKRGFWMYDGSYPKPMAGYLHSAWSGIVTNTAVSGGAIQDTAQMRWDPVHHNLWVSYLQDSALGADPIAWIFWNSISGIWTNSVSSMITAASSAIKSIISMEPTAFFVGTDKKVASAAYGSAGHASSFNTWYEGDSQSYVTVDRVIPRFVGSLVGASTSVAHLLTRDNSFTGSLSILSDVTVSARYDFDQIATAPYIAASLGIVGTWEMTHLGLSVDGGGARGKR
jgi:hypothetical protein